MSSGYGKLVLRTEQWTGLGWTGLDWTGLGDVDVVFLDKRGKMIGATVTHEGMIITPDDEDEAGLTL